MNELKGKKILFFTPAFFGYENDISNKMKSMGADVVYYDERSITSSRDKALLKISPKIFARKTRKYYEDIISRHKDDRFDIVFFIKCEMADEHILSLLRAQYPDAHFCLHMYDSIANIRGVRPKFRFFDFISSFDRLDCIENSGIHFRPLFFSDKFSDNTPQDSFLYDLCFFGTVHSDRFSIIRKVMEFCGRSGLKFYFFGYLQSRMVYLLYKITKKAFWGVSASAFSFDKKSGAEISEIVRQTNVVLDIQHMRQAGLTFRPIEVLGMGKKLITTNEDIRNYDFYDPNNICVIDRKNPMIDPEFFSKPYLPADEGIRARYEMSVWVMEVLGY